MLEFPTQTIIPAETSNEVPRTTRFSYLPLDGEAPLILTSHLGRFHAEFLDGDQPRRIRSRLAFSYREAGPAEVAMPFSPHDFWACRTTHAIDILTSKPHRLVWGLDGKGTLVTFLRPGFDLSDPSRWDIPRLIPIDQQVFEEISGLMAQQKLVKRKRGAAKKKPLAQA